jgi:hypothetical protein
MPVREFVDLSGKENLTGDERFGCSLNVTFQKS